MKCVEKVWDQNSTNLEEICGCLPECNKIEYTFAVVTERHGRYPLQTFFLNISAAISFGDDDFIAYRRFESYGAVSLLSKICGLLGLFLGVSVLSVVEVVHFVTLRLFHDLWFKFAASKSLPPGPNHHQ